MIEGIKKLRAFTFIELLIVVGILSVLAAIALFAVDPVKQFAIANDRERKEEIKEILSAIYAYREESPTGDYLPKGLVDGVLTDIPDCGKNFMGALEIGTQSDSDHINLNAALVPNFLEEIPIDPGKGYSEESTAYWICIYKNIATEKIYVIAGASENNNECDCVFPGTLRKTMCVYR